MLDKAEYSAFQSTLNSPIVSYRIVMLSSRSLTMLSTNGEIVWQPEPVCEKRVDILSTHSKNSSVGLVLAVDGVEH